MAAIISYPVFANVLETDLLLGTHIPPVIDGEPASTKNFTVGSIVSLAQAGTVAPYKVYTALLFQQGENPPVPTILQNTLDATLSYSRTDEGQYIITTTGTFPQDKTWAVINTPSYQGNGPFALQIGRISNTECNIYAYFLSSGSLKELGTNDDRVSIEIRVYN